MVRLISHSKAVSPPPRANRSGRLRATLAVAVVATTLTYGLPAAGALTVHPVPGWSPSRLPKTPSVPVTNVEPVSRQTSHRQQYTPQPFQWPASATATYRDLSGAAWRPRAKNNVLTHGSTPTRAIPVTVGTVAASTPMTPGGGALSRATLSSTVTAPESVRTSPRPSNVTIHVLPHSAAQAVGVTGYAVAVTAGSASPSKGGVALSVSLDYSTVAGAFGGGFGDRLHLVELPPCALTAPSNPACRVQTAVPGSVNDLRAERLNGDITVPTAIPTPGTQSAEASTAGVSKDTRSPAVVVAATSTGSDDDSAGDSNFGATSLAASGSWTVGSTGAFTYSYPVSVPPSVGGVAPSVALSYNSAAADGRTSATNGQASWVGDGWDYDAGYIERSYKSCNDAGQKGDYDRCWAGDNATISFSGGSGSLVPDGTPNQWRMSNDDGTIVNELSGASNGLHGGTYWQVIADDGTQYFFGADHLPASAGGNGNDSATQSAWGEPVYSTDTSSPCYDATFANSSCTLGYRWNLDFVVDPDSNLTRYDYQPESNDYAAGPNHTLAAYIRSGVLTQISYGQQVSDYAAGSQPGAEVQFTTVNRCDTSGGYNCATDGATISSSNASHFPDVPYDLNCNTTGSCTNYSPSFWSELALSRITTKIWDESQNPAAWTNVDTYQLSAPDFPQAPGVNQNGSTARTPLWLDSITHTGNDPDGGGGAASTSAINFQGTYLANRANYPNAPANVVQIYRQRMSDIVTETGETIAINYAAPTACTNSVPAEDADTTTCYPVRWRPNPQNPAILDWFNTYPVSTVSVSDNTAAWTGGNNSPSQVTNYSYAGPAWHRDDDPLTPDDERTWGQFRGYAAVTTKTGGGSDPVTEQVTDYLQGMSGDYHADNTHPAVTITNLENQAITDDPHLDGFAYQTMTYSAAGGTVQDETTSLPWVSTTATHAEGANIPDQVSAFTGTKQADHLELLASGSWRTSRRITGYDPSTGLPVTSDDLGQIDSNGNPIGSTTPEECATTSYASGAPGSNMTAYPDETISNQGACTASTNSHTLSAARTTYNQASFGTVSSPITTASVSRLHDAASSTWDPASTTTYDTYGRTVGVIDPLGHTGSTSFGSGAAGKYLPAAITQTNAKGWTTTQTVDPARQLPLTETDVNGNTTTANYDGLGRCVAVWLPDNPYSSTTTPSETYTYQISASAPISVTSQTLNDSGGFNTSITLYDAMLEQRQTQSTPQDAEAGARLITDTEYDSHGWPVYTDNYYNDASAPSTTPVAAAQSNIPTQSVSGYDGRGRTLTVATEQDAHVQWTATTAYPGEDETDTTPPTGATPSASITDARGQQVELRQFHGTTASGAYDFTDYGYDALGRQNSIIGPLAQGSSTATSRLAWSTSYDGLGDATTSTDPDTGTTTSVFDANQDLLSTTDNNNQTLSFDYDALGRKLDEYNGSTSGPKIATWQHDPTGGLGLAKSSIEYAADGTTVLNEQDVAGYDDMGDPTSTTSTIAAGAYGNSSGMTQSIAYTYTAKLHLPYSEAISNSGTSNLLPNETLAFSYNDEGLPMASGGTNSYVSSVNYDPYGNLLRASMGYKPNQLVLTNSYDQGTNRLLTSSTSIENDTTGPIDTTNLTYNQAGEITSAQDVRNTSGGTATTDLQCYTFDYLQRLSNVWTDTGGVTATAGADGGIGHCTDTTPGTKVGGGPAPYWQSFGYDLAGDRLNQTDHAVTKGLATSSALTSTYADPGSVHALSSTSTGSGTSTTTTSYGYTKDGQTQNSTVKTGSTVNTAAGQTFTWNPTGTLAKLITGAPASPAHTTSYGYDASGALIAQTDDGASTLYLGADTVTVNSSGTVSGVTRSYQFAGAPTAVRVVNASSNVLHYQVANPQGTGTTDVTSDLKSIVRRGYTPFGQDRAADDVGTGWANNRGFVGGTKDPTTALTNLGAREYNPTLGRFMNPDPVLNASDPQSINGYAYSDNDPVNGSDASGALVTFCVDGPGSGCVTAGTGSAPSHLEPRTIAPNDYTTKHDDVVRSALVYIRQIYPHAIIVTSRENAIPGASKNAPNPRNPDATGYPDIAVFVKNGDSWEILIYEVKAITKGKTASAEAEMYAQKAVGHTFTVGGQRITPTSGGLGAPINGPHMLDAQGQVDFPNTRFAGPFAGAIYYYDQGARYPRLSVRTVEGLLGVEVAVAVLAPRYSQRASGPTLSDTDGASVPLPGGAGAGDPDQDRTLVGTSVGAADEFGGGGDKVEDR